MKLKTSLLIIALGFFSLVSIVVATGIGATSISPEKTLKVLVQTIPFLKDLVENPCTPTEVAIILNLRLPRVLLGMIVGASLSLCGVAMQALVRNHLAEPFILGVSSGASAFATLSMLFGAFSFLGVFSLSISAFLGAFVTITLVYIISRVRGRINVAHLLLSGVAISMIMDGITAIIKLSAPNALGLHNAEFWMSGSLAGARWEYLGLPAAIMLICGVVLLINHRGLNALLLGDKTAGTLGVNPENLHRLLILTSSLMAGVTVAVSGTIGFVGLIIPHLTRLITGADHKKVLPISALLGGILVVWVDVFARTIIAPQELPVGILTAIIGGPIFIWLLKSTGRGGAL